MAWKWTYMVKNSKNTVLKIIICAVVVLIITVSTAVAIKLAGKSDNRFIGNSAAITYDYGNKSVLPTVEISADITVNNMFSRYGICVANGDIAEIVEGSPTASGFVKESDVDKLREYHNLEKSDNICAKFGNMDFYKEINSHQSFIFSKTNFLTFVYDDKILEIPVSTSSMPIVDYGDEYCIIEIDDDVYSVNYDTMTYKKFNAIKDYPINIFPIGGLTHSLVVDGNTIVKTALSLDESSIAVINYDTKQVDEILVPGTVASVTLNDDGKSVTIISTNANGNEVFSEISVYTAPIFKNEDKNSLEAEFLFSAKLPDSKSAYLDSITKSVRNDDIIAFLSHDIKSDAFTTANNVICVNVSERRIEAMRTVEITEKAAHYNSILYY